MRIVGGRLRGRALAAPKSQAIRPTADRLRESLFNILTNAYDDPISGARVLDLFAGTGALGLEALSRGAASCTFVEKDRAALDILRRNIDRLGAGDRAEIRAQAVEHAPPPPRPCDLVMLDPPYGAGLAQAGLDRAAAWLAPGGWLSVEVHGESLTLPEGLVLDAERRFGKATLLLIRRSAAANT